MVVGQSAQGDFRAFSAICTHQGCTEQQVVDGTIDFRCHGSRFDAAEGSVLRGPAQQPLGQQGVAVQAGMLTLR